MGIVNGRRITFRGQSRRHYSVGAGKQFDFTTLQSALDAITDAAAENRYVITVAPGIYEGRITHDKSYVDVHGEAGPHGTILRLGSSNATSGGTLRIGTATLTTDVCISNLRVVRNQSGASTPPEGAIYVGAESTHPVSATWTNILLDGIVAEGVHDGVQVFGLDNSHSGEAPYCTVRNSVIRCSHDALTLKGSARLLSQGNFMDVDSRGRSPYLTDVGEWKSTGIHFGVERGNGPSSSSWLISSNDVIHVRDGTNVDLASPPAGAFQRRIAGVLVYVASAPASSVTVCPVRIINPTILVEWNVDGDPSGGGPYCINTYTTTNVTFPIGAFEIIGGSLKLHQQSAGASAPADVYAVLHHAEVATSYMQIVGTYITAVNAKAGGNAYAMLADHASSTIYASVYSHNTNPQQTGTVSAMPTLP